MLQENIKQVSRRNNLSQNVVQQLIELIMDGTIKNGEKLPAEKQLMEMFGVGRSTLREAIRALEVLGLVEVKVPGGTFVVEEFGDFFTKNLGLISKISFNNIIELVEARAELEVILVDMAARKATKEDIKELEENINKMKNCSGNEEFLESDLEFHILVSKIAKNSFMSQVMNILREVTREWISKVIGKYSVKEEVIAQHEKVFLAIKNGDRNLAKVAMAEHLKSVGDLLLEYHDEV